MLYRTRCALIVLGDRVEKGQVVNLTEDQAAPLMGDLKPIGSGPVIAEEAKPEDKKIEDMSRLELVELAEKEGLSSKGTKADLVERLTLHYQSNEE